MEALTVQELEFDAGSWQGQTNNVLQSIMGGAGIGALFGGVPGAVIGGTYGAVSYCIFYGISHARR